VSELGICVGDIGDVGGDEWSWEGREGNTSGLRDMWVVGEEFVSRNVWEMVWEGWVRWDGGDLRLRWEF
jgi:hypothetical protein